MQDNYTINWGKMKRKFESMKMVNNFRRQKWLTGESILEKL